MSKTMCGLVRYSPDSATAAGMAMKIFIVQCFRRIVLNAELHGHVVIQQGCVDERLLLTVLAVEPVDLGSIQSGLQLRVVGNVKCSPHHRLLLMTAVGALKAVWRHLRHITSCKGEQLLYGIRNFRAVMRGVIAKDNNLVKLLIAHSAIWG
jgi:hypothetical protein